MTISKMNPLALGITLGALSAIAVLGFGILAHTFFAEAPISVTLGTMNISYIPSFQNILVYSILGFINGTIGGYIFSKLYNILIDAV